MSDSSEISVATAAGLIGCSSKTVIRLLERGDLLGWRISDRGWWRVTQESVLRFIGRRRGPRLSRNAVRAASGSARWRPAHNNPARSSSHGRKR